MPVLDTHELKTQGVTFPNNYGKEVHDLVKRIMGGGGLNIFDNFSWGSFLYPSPPCVHLKCESKFFPSIHLSFNHQSIIEKPKLTFLLNINLLSLLNLLCTDQHREKYLWKRQKPEAICHLLIDKIQWFITVLKQNLQSWSRFSLTVCVKRQQYISRNKSGAKENLLKQESKQSYSFVKRSRKYKCQFKLEGKNLV